MNALRLLVAGFVVVGLTAGVRAEKKEEKKDNAKLLLGSWEATKAAEGTLPVGAVVTFEKDGKFKTVVKEDGKEMAHGGTYKVDGDKFTLTMKFGEEENKLTITIKKISDTELITSSQDGKVVEFKRKK